MREPLPLKGLVAFLRLPARTKAVALEAALALLVARLLVEHVPMRLWRRRLNTVGDSAGPAEGPGGPPPLRVPRNVARVVRKVARRLPWLRARCLPKAMAAQWMLRRRKIRSRLVFGARRATSPETSLEFHAWLIVAGECVIGAQEVETFSVLAPPEAASRQPLASAPAAPRRQRGRPWLRRNRRTTK